ncbi:hypothetical protein R75461_07273 [Paraburkholderia nemoris]|uniref:helix-turn-helix transcriptional regulator n=1 Tax=Paraburkholderia nemoris TaxID=2793076 RepID=UPI00190DDD7C|nr:autoinducer binding domain-containing protein [Paraburkholderia nemoris]MBK3786073.1 LuxR family transcriptional regulator [Paraburkholderia aspalathi]CAE6846608.1 hypothetical protein R75461_07273 [Paraburkholderia nemoris]
MSETTLEKRFQDIIAATDESELVPCIRDVIEGLGGQWFVFVSLHPSDQSDERASHRFLIGCKPEWCQLYNANKWYVTDPCLDYARTNTSPILGTDLKLRTAGQREMLAVAAENGFRSGYIIPVHASERGRIGVLYVGSDEDPRVGGPKMSRNRPLFLGLALELLNWSSRSLRKEILSKYQITEDEVKLAEYVRSGFTANDIAKELGRSAATVYSHFRKFNEKIGVTHITAAVKFAEEHDLFS